MAENIRPDLKIQKGEISMGIEIRKFQQQDISQAVDLCDEIREYHRNILNGYFAPINRDFEKNALLETLKNDSAFALVAVADDNVVGLLIAHKKIAPYLEKQIVCNIGTLGVTKKYRKQGIGQKLMKRFLELCKEQGIQEIKLGVFNDNQIAYRFYEDFGFTPQQQTMSLKITD